MNFKSLFLRNLLNVIHVVFGKTNTAKYADGLVNYWAESTGSPVRLLPISLYFASEFFLLNLHQSLFSLAILCRTIFPLVLSVLVLPRASSSFITYLTSLVILQDFPFQWNLSPPINSHCTSSLTLFPVLSVTAT